MRQGIGPCAIRYHAFFSSDSPLLLRRAVISVCHLCGHTTADRVARPACTYFCLFRGIHIVKVRLIQLLFCTFLPTSIPRPQTPKRITASHQPTPPLSVSTYSTAHNLTCTNYRLYFPQRPRSSSLYKTKTQAFNPVRIRPLPKWPTLHTVWFGVT